MGKYKDILRYHFVGLSQRQTAEVVGVVKGNYKRLRYLNLNIKIITLRQSITV